MRKLWLFIPAFLALVAWLVGCDDAATEVPTDPASDQLPTFKVKPGESYEEVAEWGGNGHGPGQILGAQGIALDQQGNVYVLDWLNHRVQKFTSDGTFLTMWGETGWGDGQFTDLETIAVDKHGSVYVLDRGPDSVNYVGRVQKFTSDGSFLARWEFGETYWGTGIAVDKHGNVYLADTYNHQIQKLDSDGNLLTKWGSYGTADGEFNLPRRVAVDKHNNVYVTDSQNDRVQKFTSDGAFITKWGSTGSGAGQFWRPRGITVDNRGSVFVADPYNDRVQKFTSEGEYLTEWSPGMSAVEDLAADRHGNVYLAIASFIEVWTASRH